MKRLLLLFSWATGVLALMGNVSAETDPALREQGVFYLEGNVPGKVTATIHASTVVYLHRDFQMALANLGPGEAIEVVGTSPEGYLVKGTYRNNSVVGWIHPQDLPTGVNPGIFIAAKKVEEHRAAVTIAVANKSVIPGMTPEEVEQAMGHPSETHSRTDVRGSSIVWVFTTFREDPQYNYSFDAFGRPVLQTYYVKIPIGQMVVSFANGVVSTIEDHESNPNSPGVVTN